MSGTLDTGDFDLSGFITAVATAEPLPAGVAVAALTAALAAALAEMGAGLALKRTADGTDAEVKAEVDTAELRRVRSEAVAWRAALLRAIEEDSAAYRAYMAARKLPREGDAARRLRDNALARTRLAAALAPLSIAGMAYDILGFLGTVAARSGVAMRSDLASGAILAEAAVRCATLAVRTNLRGHPDETERDDLLAQAATLARRAAQKCATIV
ncbi:MAG TPA: cyclodeaminase/cyclohydrolase family protein, partial [Thermomicrobiales bacterium]